MTELSLVDTGSWSVKPILAEISRDDSLVSARESGALRYLLAARLINQEQFDYVQQAHKPIVDEVVSLGFASAHDVAECLSSATHAPVIALKRFGRHQSLTKMLPERIARELQVVVINEAHDAYVVAAADPTDPALLFDLQRELKRDVVLRTASVTMIKTCLTDAYTASSDGLDPVFPSSISIDDAEPSKLMSQLTGTARAINAEVVGSSASIKASSESNVSRFIDKLFESAIASRASDVHIEPTDHDLIVRFRIDGEMQHKFSAPIKIASAIAQRLKMDAHLDIDERRRPQDGAFSFEIDEYKVDIRLSVLPTRYGESLVMRLRHHAGEALMLDALAMPKDIEDAVRRTISRSSGSLIVTGPTGSGKSTTLCAAISALESNRLKIVTIEDPIEYELSGVSQIEVDDDIELTFGAVLRSVMRHDPDVVMVGEIRDKETAQIGMQAALSGHLVFSTLHANDAASVAPRLINIGVDPVIVSSALRAVLSQRLVPLNCRACSRPDEEADVGLISRLMRKDFQGDNKPMRSPKRIDKDGRSITGCTECDHRGFKGRVAVYELLELDGNLRALAAAGDIAAFVNEANRQLEGRRIVNHGAQLVAQGLTTLEEILRLEF